ncbi:MAG TPA: DUF2779 domain-containing protein [Clostridia bacterium]|jgi:hypothetical protein|nr:DUF2779 domain-containing protein [Clostridia bacterium]
MRFSKTRYVEFCQCPKITWLAQNKPEERVIDDNLRALFAEGNVVGDLAMGLFGDFVETTAYTAEGKIDLSTMIENTKRFLSEGQNVIAEAAFDYNGLYCAVDILKKDGKGYAIYEVKSATKSDKNVYYIDIAYQKYVLEHCGVNVTKTYLVTINSDYVRMGELDINQLFTITDCSSEVEVAKLDVENNLAQAEKVLQLTDEPNIDLSEACFSPYSCTFWQYCSKHLPIPSVFDLYRLTTAKKFSYYSEGKVKYSDFYDDSYVNSHIIRRFQVLSETNDEPFIDKEGIKEFLSQLKYPLYFLDFETEQNIIPPFDNTKPYGQIPFQYSLHYIERKDEKLQHKEFLGISGEDSRRIIAEKLVADIPKDACIIAYNKSFERRIINELAGLFLDLAEPLMEIHSNFVDLLDVFTNGYLYIKEMGGSMSIKSVLPAMFPNDPELNYDNLEGVHNGEEAMRIFKQIKDMPEDEQAIARQNLLDYCKLDTLAMVRIWQKLQELSK